MRGGHHEPTPRRPAHAGTFYPASPEAVTALVERCGGTPVPRSPMPADVAAPRLGILVPHAGLVYSGSVAAKGWRALAEAQPESVVIAGTNHVAGWLAGAAVWPSGDWLTPGAATPVDEELAERILGLGGGFEADREAHRREHAIEVQLPFVARMLPGARVVPITVYFESFQRCIAAGNALGELLVRERATGRRVVVAISTDFAHYPAEADAHRVDRQLLEPIARLDPEELGRLETAIRRSRLPGLVCGMCGIEAAVFGLAALRAMGAGQADVLAEATSADVPFGQADRTVGYAAVAFS